jgi:hypothetical protein
MFLSSATVREAIMFGAFTPDLMMFQHFLFSPAARTLSLSVVARMSEEEVRQAFTSIRWDDKQGKPYCLASPIACPVAVRRSRWT